jgi:cation transport regulator
MPYRTNDDLPPAVRRLPGHAQDIFREAFNRAWDSYGHEDTAFRVAWAAVKKGYHKIGDRWLPRG